MSPPRRPSSIKASTRESGRTSKKKHSFRGARYTSPHLSNSPTDSDGIELDYRHSKAASPRGKETPQSADRLTHTGSVETQTQSTVNPSSFFSSGTIASNLGDDDQDSDTFIFGGVADGKAGAPGHPLPVTHPHPKPQPQPHPHHPLARSQDRSRPLSNEGTTGSKASFKASAGHHTVLDESSGSSAVVPLRSAYLSRSPLSSPVHTVVQGDLPPAYEDIR